MEYQRFLHTFSEDGNVVVIGTQGDALYTPANFRAWYDLGNDLKTVHGIDSVFSEAHLYQLVRDDSLKRFRVEQLFVQTPGPAAGQPLQGPLRPPEPVRG